MMHRWIVPVMLLVALLIVSLLGFTLSVLDHFGSYLMVAAAIALAFVAAKRAKR